MADLITDPGTGCTIREMAGRSGSDSAESDTIERSFLVKGSSDPLVCRQAVINQEIALELFSFANLGLDTLSWKLHAGSDAWAFTAGYSWTPEPGGYTIQMDSTGGTVKQTDAYAQQAYPGASGPAPNYGYSVNVQDGKVEGVDRVIPALKLNVNARIAAQWVSNPIGYAKTVAGLTGSVNNAPYLGFAAGELLFLGATGEIVGENPLLNYSFAASANVSGLQVGPISGITKNGHDYLWIKYLTEKDSSANLNVQIAQAAYVAQVYTYADFGPLRIGEA